jgi:hypothetical protein
VKDFNGVGIPDVAVGFAGGVRLLLGDGTFQTTPISYAAGGYPANPNRVAILAVADFKWRRPS